MSQKQSKYVWSFNRFLPQFGEPLSAEQYLAQNNVFDSTHGICFNTERGFPSANKMIQLVWDLITDIAQGEVVPDPKETFSTLHQYDMEWCKGTLYWMRKQLISAYLNSIEDGICNEMNNCMDIDTFCDELVQQIHRSEQYFQQSVNWSHLVIFLERFACIKSDDLCQDISFKHWMMNEANILPYDEFTNILTANINRRLLC